VEGKVVSMDLRTAVDIRLATGLPRGLPRMKLLGIVPVPPTLGVGARVGVTLTDWRMSLAVIFGDTKSLVRSFHVEHQRASLH
jgi:hypothetical protein